MSVSGTSSIYTQGDIVLETPVEATTTFLFVILISAVLEFGIDTAADVENKYFRVMFEAVNQEVMIVGLLILACSFAQTIYDWPSRWILIFQWAMMVLFFMALFFVSLVMYTLFAVNVTTKRWLLFEIERMDSGVPLGGREMQYKRSFNGFQSALQAFGYDASMGIRFSEYLAKLMRRNVVALTDLTWVCWVCLATLVILNTLRSEATRQFTQLGDENLEDEQTEWQRLVQYVSFIAVIGYGILTFYLIVHHVLSTRLNTFLSKGLNKTGGADGPAAGGGGAGGGRMAAAEQGLITRDDLEDSNQYLFRRSREATMELLQVIILSLEWFTSTFFLSFSNEIIQHLGWGAGAPLFIFAAIPAIVFSALLPWTLTLITLLSSLGTNLDEDSVRYLIIKAGIPESDWPPHMREALRRAQAREDEDDGGVLAATSESATVAMNNASFARRSALGAGSFRGGLSFAASPNEGAPAKNASFAGFGSSRPLGGQSVASHSTMHRANTHGDQEEEDEASAGPSRPMPRGLGQQPSRPLPEGGIKARTEAFMSL